MVEQRLDAAKAMADQDEAFVALLAQTFQGAVAVLGAVLELFIGRAAEVGEIAGAVDPVVAASVDDEQ